MRYVSRTAMLMILLGLVSCSSGKKTDGDDKGQVTEMDMKVVSLAMVAAADGYAPQPVTKIEQVEVNMRSSDVDNEGILAKVKSGEIVLVYGFNMESLYSAPGGAAEQVVAYQKDCSTKGGWVGMGNWKAKKVTAEEFKKLKLAPAAKK